MPYAHLPYQDMGELPGIQTLFLAEPVAERINSSELTLIPRGSIVDEFVAKFDMTCSLDYNDETHSITVSLNASADLFDVETISTMARRFECLLDQLFISVPSSVCEVSLLLEHEIELLHKVNMNNKFQHQLNLLLIHEQFAYRVEEHPQKLAVVLDNQCLTYAELFYLAQVVAYHLINVCLVKSNDIVPLCVERSLEMPIGILATLMCNAIYCPLTPNHPPQRLQAILRQTNARCILTHHMTTNKFDSTTVNLSSFAHPNSIDVIESFNIPSRGVDEIAYIIFTSGSTGEPKGVQLTHRNLLLTVASYAYIGSILPTDTALQITPCSFDAHVPELLGCLFMGGTSILLHPDGNMQLDYLTSLVQRHQASYMHSVPSHLTIICEQLEKDNVFERLITLRSLCSSGEPMDIRSLGKFRQNTRATIFNLYGPAECTDVSIYKLPQNVKQVIEPACIGQLSPNLVCHILDPYMQTILPDGHQIGELFVSGPSVFPGYLNRNDLTQHVLINELPQPGQQYYKTGDLVRLDASGSFHYVGRRDFMVKLRGQRIELAEIEHTILNASPNITRCVVIKHEYSKTNHEYLIAYVQTIARNIELMLQQKCQEQLPSYMVPSVFVLLDKLPLSTNGKIDRRHLPQPDLIIEQNVQQRGEQPKTDMETKVATIWCEILRLDIVPSTTTSFYQLGGNSLLLMKLYYSYHKIVQFDINSLVISQLFRQPTIINHAHLLEAHQPIIESPWDSFHCTKGPASFAQTRLYLDERLRFNTSVNTIATYHIPLVYEIIKTPISLKRLHRSLCALIEKHKILRTRLIFDENDGELKQEILEKILPVIIITKVENEKQVEKIVYDEETNPNLFELNEGKVFRCHIIRRSTSIDEDLLLSSDILIFNFHHIAFDGASIDIFFHDLQRSYSMDEFLPSNIFDYIDYSIHEKEMKMDDAKSFWKQHLDGFSNSYLQLPYDHNPNNSNIRSGRGTTVNFELSPRLVDQILNYSNECETTLFQVGLATFYAFLFKLTQQTDLCVLTVSSNRHRAELEHIIGFFVNTLPHRLNINPYTVFRSLVDHVRELILSTLPYAHLPYQEIVSGVNSNVLQTLFIVETHHDNGIALTSDTILRPLVTMPIDPQTVAKFDLTCSLLYDVPTHSIKVSLDASSDLFELETVESIALRFHLLLNQLFSSPASTPICEFSLLLSHEIDLLEHLNNEEHLNSNSNLLLIHEQFAHQVEQHPQKLAVILDEQSLTYAELFHLSQLIACHLKNEYHVKSGDIIGQCIERSIEMIIGILSILMCGGSYCPLSPDQPLARINSLIEQVQMKCVLTHNRTNTLVSFNHINVEEILLSSNNIVINKVESVCDQQTAYFVFTSGSTGTPKVVPISHKNFTVCMNSLTHSLIMTHNDIVLQTTPVTFDIHIQEILGTLWLGGTLCLLRPKGNLDMNYYTLVVERHQITLLIMVPTLISVLIQHLHTCVHHQNSLASVRRLCSLGETLPPKTASRISELMNSTACLFNLYGPAECTLISTFHLVTLNDLKSDNVPIGRPLAGYACHILDTYFQPVICGHQIGQLFIGGKAVFEGYFHRPDLSDEILVHLPKREGLFYQTGDLVRIDAKSGLLYYVGRNDFQVKLRGQRIELCEIESVIMRLSSEIISCIVIKYDYNNLEHLVAYIQTNVQLNMNILHKQCSKYLPLYMVPSLFIFIDQYPLNINGKINRKALPLPDFLLLISSFDSTMIDDQPHTEIERQISSIWIQVLCLESIPSINISFFRLGGHSLLLMKLHHIYQTYFHQSIDISDLFRHTTIIDHIHLLKNHQIIINEQRWQSFNIIKGPASYAQMDVWLSERTRLINCSDILPAYNMSKILKIDSGYLSIDRCLHTLNSIVDKHWIFRTRLTFDVEGGILYQSIDQTITYPFRVSTIKDEQQQTRLLHEEMWTPFDTERYGVFRCHFIQYDHGDKKDNLLVGDLLVFYFHHGSFDGRAMDLFLDEFKVAYAGGELQTPCLQYIDYSTHERNLAMIEARTYWSELLRNYAWDRLLDLGQTKKPLSACRTGRGEQLSFAIPSSIAHSMIFYADQLNVTLFQLGLTCFYLFLNQLSYHNRDACIGVIHLNRYRPEIVSMIGMFVNILPCRIVNIDLEKLSFIELLYKIQQTFLQSIQHAYLPYDELINLYRIPTYHLQLPYLQTVFSVDTTIIDYTNMDDIIFDDSCHLSTYKKQEKDIEIGFKYDLDVSFAYDKDAITIDCVWAYMFDVFQRKTIEQHANRFNQLLNQLFGSNRIEQLQIPLNQIVILDKDETIKDNQEKDLSCSTSVMNITQQTELINSIRSIFSRILDCRMIDVDVNKSFFEQGGTSLKALQAVTLLQKEISNQINIHFFFDHLSVVDLVHALTNDSSLFR